MIQQCLVELKCDGDGDDCDELLSCYLEAFGGGLDTRQLDEQLERNDWTCVGRDKHYCPACSETRRITGQDAGDDDDEEEAEEFPHLLSDDE